MLAQGVAQLDPVEARHVEVGQDRVWTMLGGQVQCGNTVGGADDLHVGRVKIAVSTSRISGVVIGNQD